MSAAHPPFAVVLSRDDILRRIHELARAIAGRHPEPPALVAVMEGARTFADHLRRVLPGQPRYQEVRARSYGERTESSGKVEVASGNGLDVRGRPVLLLEDIVDTGRTATELRRHLLAHGAESVEICALLSKPSRRVVEIEVDHLGFEIDDQFVIGFGMDVAGRYRELPCLAVYDPEVERSHVGAQRA